MTFVVAVLVVLGGCLMLVAGLGVFRMPDLPTRMHASSKAGTLGAALVLLAVALDAGGMAVAVRALLVVAFLFLTAPVASHVIARAAYRTGVPLSDETVVDELATTRSASAAAPPATTDLQTDGDQGAGMNGARSSGERR